MKTIQTIAGVIALVAAAACSSVRYGDPDAVETVNIDWGSTDLQTFAQKMVQSLVDSPQLAYLAHPGKGDDQRIIVYMGGVRNDTSEHIDTQGITDSIRTSLLKSGRFRFVAGEQGQSELGEQVRFQQGSGRVNPEMAKEFGKQLGADMVIYGNLRSIEKTRGRSIESAGTKKEDVYYQFVLNAVNIETGEIIWSEEQDLRKTAKTGLFGRT
jgi:penicillin-binding protein activator